MTARRRLLATLPFVLGMFAAHKGVPTGAIEEALGYPMTTPPARDTYTSADTIMRVWALVGARCPGEALGLEFAHMLTLSELGVVGQVMRFSETVGHALRAVQRFQHLVDSGYHATLQERGEHAWIGLAPDPLVEEAVHPLDAMIASMRLTGAALGADITPELVCFRHAGEVAPASVYEEFFGAPVRFNQPESGLLFDRAALAHRPETADAFAAHYLTSHAEQLAQHHPVTARAERLELRVRSLLTSALERGAELLQATEVAAELGMSPRSLQRGLREEGASFTTLAREVRAARAAHLLRDPDLAVYEVAFLLGYGEAASFHKAFRQWTGQTPAQFRAGVLA